MFLVEANVRGSGKSLLIDVIGVIATGSGVARMINADSDDEMRKRITALALEGERTVLLDNVSNALGCSSLDAALTAPAWKDRILGSSKNTHSIPLLMTWYATGNNVAVVGDTTRRIAHIRLNSQLERPEERDGFTHPNLLEWVRQERYRLVPAALTVLRGFCVSGRPKQTIKPWGSYEGWSSLVREAIVWMGLTDPGESREELVRNGDREASALRLLLDGWEEIAPRGAAVTVGDAFDLIDTELQRHRAGQLCGPPRYAGLRQAIAELCRGTSAGKLPSAGSFGMKLHHLRGRVVGGKVIDSKTVNNQKAWFVRVIGSDDAETGTRGSTGTNPHSLPTHGNMSNGHYSGNLEADMPEAGGLGNSPRSTSSPRQDAPQATAEMEELLL
jgi:hypothetical protein